MVLTGVEELVLRVGIAQYESEVNNTGVLISDPVLSSLSSQQNNF